MAIQEWALRIARLRKRLRLSQGQIARKLECSTMTISRWERGLLAPSAEYYIRLGILADGSDTWFFWGQAGLQASDVARKLKASGAKLSTAAALEKAHAGISPSLTDSEVVAIPLLKAAVGAHGCYTGTKKLSLDRTPATRMMTAPAEWCPNPGYTSLVRVKGDSMEPLIRDGDIVAVDSFQIEPDALDGKVVIVSSEQGGLCVSRLHRYPTLTVLESESRKSPAIVMDKESGMHILGRVLWWISAAP